MSTYDEIRAHINNSKLITDIDELKRLKQEYALTNNIRIPGRIIALKYSINTAILAKERTISTLLKRRLNTQQKTTLQTQAELYRTLSTKLDEFSAPVSSMASPATAGSAASGGGGGGGPMPASQPAAAPSGGGGGGGPIPAPQPAAAPTNMAELETYIQGLQIDAALKATIVAGINGDDAAYATAVQRITEVRFRWKSSLLTLMYTLLPGKFLRYAPSVIARYTNIDDKVAVAFNIITTLIQDENIQRVIRDNLESGNTAGLSAAVNTSTLAEPLKQQLLAVLEPLCIEVAAAAAAAAATGAAAAGTAAAPATGAGGTGTTTVIAAPATGAGGTGTTTVIATAPGRAAASAPGRGGPPTATAAPATGAGGTGTTTVIATAPGRAAASAPGRGGPPTATAAAAGGAPPCVPSQDQYNAVVAAAAAMQGLVTAMNAARTAAAGGTQPRSRWNPRSWVGSGGARKSRKHSGIRNRKTQRRK
jgi:hypothetical protein